MKLKDVKHGQKFILANDKVITEILVKKRPLNEEYCLVGLPGVNDVFAVPWEEEVITED